MLAGEPAAQRQHRLGNLVMGAAAAMPLDQRCRRLAESAGLNLHRDALDAAVTVELYGHADAAAASRRADFGGTILAIEVVRFAQRCGKPENFSRIEWLAHSLRHVVPPGPSSKTTPSALSSSRMRSAVAKSRFFFASARAAMRSSMADASPSPWNHSADELLSSPSSCALAFRAPPSSCASRDRASGVLRSSHNASSTPAST